MALLGCGAHAGTARPKQPAGFSEEWRARPGAGAGVWLAGQAGGPATCSTDLLLPKRIELQVWMPEQCADGTVVLSCQVGLFGGMPAPAPWLVPWPGNGMLDLQIYGTLKSWRGRWSRTRAWKQRTGETLKAPAETASPVLNI